MKRRLIYMHSRRAEFGDFGFAYDVPEISVFESDCDLNALMVAMKADAKTPWDERGYRLRGPFFYCEKCNLVVLEWDVNGSMGSAICPDCAYKMKYNIVIQPHAEGRVRA